MEEGGDQPSVETSKSELKDNEEATVNGEDKTNKQEKPNEAEPANEEVAERTTSKKKKVRRHRASKNGHLSRVEEESDEEDNRRKGESLRERRLSWAKKQLAVEDEDDDDIPTLNYKSDEKKPSIEITGEFEEPDPPKADDQKTEEEELEEEEDPCMTTEEKEAMHHAAVIGDVDLLEDCLDKPNADINMVWYYDNLLVAALKSGQGEMAEFLIDNGVDYNFKTPLIHVKDDQSRNIECYTSTCRQLAFEKGLLDVVELIDYLNGDLFSFIKPKVRIKRYRRPKPPTPEPSTGGESENDASSEASKDCSEIDEDGKMKKRKKKKRKTSKDEEGENSGKDVGKANDKKKSKNNEKMVESFDNDSGHHSFDSAAEMEKGGTRTDSPRRKSTGSTRYRSGSSRLSISLTSVSSSPPPISKSETFLKKFVFMCSGSDEGYGTLSPKSSPTSLEARQKKVVVPITIPPRGTKSSLGLKASALQKKSLLEQPVEKPLQQKKVNTVGSYKAESTRWHKSSKKAKTESVLEIKNDPKHKNDLQGTIGFKSGSSMTKVPKRADAHYMQMTASSKRKLEPKFRTSYKSLDFVSPINVTSTISQTSKMSEKAPRPYDSMWACNSPQIRNSSVYHHQRVIKRVW